MPQASVESEEILRPKSAKKAAVDESIDSTLVLNPPFLGLSHRRRQDFQRVGAPGSRISGWGTMEGPKEPSEAR